MKSSIENIYKLKVNQIIDYIKFNLHQPLQLNVIADIVNVSQRQLLCMMSSVLNEPLYPYVARQHVERSVLYMQTEEDRKSTRLNSSHWNKSRMPSSA